MANKENIFLLSKYQMRVLYYKCTQGLTHAEIAELLNRDVNTVQYHMTKIYTILEIKKPGKSKEEMESELKNEICPIIREMFPTYDRVKIWARVIKGKSQEEEENLDEELDEPVVEEAQPLYEPPPSVEKLLNPEIIGPPPPGRRRLNWRQIIWFIVIGLLIIIVLISFPWFMERFAKPTKTPTQSISTRTAPPLSPSEVPTSTPTISIIPTRTNTPTASPSPSFTPNPPDRMVYIPAGEFQMGSSRAGDPQEEFPGHSVYLDAYWIDRTEVTNAQYALCVASGGCTRPANNYSSTHDSYYDNSAYAGYPVIFVSWSQAVAYCAWADLRLPTEAEWEKAARGPEGFIYPWGNTFDGTLANSCDTNCPNIWKGPYDDGYTDTSPVGNYPKGASMYGVLDMAGNVHEWVADWFASYPSDYQSNPTGPASGQDRIMRGGSWGDDPDHVRSDVRSPINPDSWMDFIGFRCARQP